MGRALRLGLMLALPPRWGWKSSRGVFQGFTPLAINCRPVGAAEVGPERSHAGRPLGIQLTVAPLGLRSLGFRRFTVSQTGCTSARAADHVARLPATVR